MATEADSDDAGLSAFVFKGSLGGDNHNRPRVLIMDACSGSTFMQTVGRELLKRHGFKGSGYPYEISKKQKNPEYRKDRSIGLGAAMTRMAEKTAERGATLAFKASLHTYESEPDFVSNMTALQAYSVHVWRNPVDQAVCMVRDCLRDQLGYPINGKGKKSKLCFERRHANVTEEYKAHMFADRVARFVNKTVVRHTKLPTNFVENLGIPAPETFVLEDLLAFEWAPKASRAISNTKAASSGCTDAGCSVRAWCRFLQAWGVEKPDARVVSNYLGELESRGAPAPHKDVIDNWRQVQAALVSLNPDLKVFWRD